MRKVESPNRGSGDWIWFLYKINDNISSELTVWLTARSALALGEKSVPKLNHHDLKQTVAIVVFLKQKAYVAIILDSGPNATTIDSMPLPICQRRTARGFH